MSTDFDRSPSLPMASQRSHTNTELFYLVSGLCICMLAVIAVHELSHYLCVHRLHDGLPSGDTEGLQSVQSILAPGPNGPMYGSVRWGQECEVTTSMHSGSSASKNYASAAPVSPSSLIDIEALTTALEDEAQRQARDEQQARELQTIRQVSQAESSALIKIQANVQQQLVEGRTVSICSNQRALPTHVLTPPLRPFVNGKVNAQVKRQSPLRNVECCSMTSEDSEGDSVGKQKGSDTTTLASNNGTPSLSRAETLVEGEGLDAELVLARALARRPACMTPVTARARCLSRTAWARNGC